MAAMLEGEWWDKKSPSFNPFDPYSESGKKWIGEQLANKVVDCPNGHTWVGDWDIAWRVNRRWFTGRGLDRYMRREFGAVKYHVHVLMESLHKTFLDCEPDQEIHDKWPPKRAKK